MVFRPFLTIDVIALIALTISFLIGLRLKFLMGKGKDTGPVKIILIIISINVLLGILLLLGGYQKLIGEYVNYVRLTDVMLMIIGITLAIALYKVYKDYKQLLKRHEPNF
jgi:hypothetical protein